MYIFGGNDIRMGTMNNLWSFGMTSIDELREGQSQGAPMEWKLIKTHGKIPGK